MKKFFLLVSLFLFVHAAALLAGITALSGVSLSPGAPNPGQTTTLSWSYTCNYGPEPEKYFIAIFNSCPITSGYGASPQMHVMVGDLCAQPTPNYSNGCLSCVANSGCDEIPTPTTAGTYSYAKSFVIPTDLIPGQTYYAIVGMGSYNVYLQGTGVTAEQQACVPFTVPLTAPYIHLRKSSEGTTGSVGTKVLFTIYYDAGNVHNFRITDAVDSRFTILQVYNGGTAAGQNITWVVNSGYITSPVKGSVSFLAQINSGSAGTVIPNTAVGTATEVGGSNSNVANVVIGQPGLSVSKSVSAINLNPGDTITYTMQYVNQGTTLVESENFDGGTIPAGWVNNPAGGTWNAAPGYIQRTDNGAGYFAYLDNNVTPMHDGIYECDMMVPSANTAHWDGVMHFIQVDSNNFYMARINASDKKLYLDTVVGGVSNIGGTSVAMPHGLIVELDKWYTVKVQVCGSQISMKVWPQGDNEYPAWDLSVTDNQIPGNGIVGFQANEGPGKYDNLKVFSLTASTNPRLFDTVPAGITYISCSGGTSCSKPGTVVNWTVGSTCGGVQSVSWIGRVTGTCGQTITNTAGIDSDDSPPPSFSNAVYTGIFCVPSPTSTRTTTPTVAPTNTISPTTTPSRTITPSFTYTLTPASTPTFTRTATASASPSPSPSATPTRTQTATYTRTQTPPSSPTFTRTLTSTPSQSPSATFSHTPTRTPSPTFTNSTSPTFTATVTRTPSYTPTRTPSQSPSATFSFTPTRTASPTFTSSTSPTFTATVTRTPSYTPTRTPSPSNTVSPSNTFTRTYTPTFSATPTITVTSINTPTITPTRTFTFTASPTFTPTFTASATPTNTPTRTASPTFTNSTSPTFTFTVTRTYTGTSTRTPTPSFTATPTVTITSLDTPTNTFTRTPSFTATLSSTSTMTPTFTMTWSSTATRSSTPTVTITSMDTPTSTFTRTPSFTVTLTSTSTNTPSYTMTWSPTATRSATPTVTITTMDTPTPTFSITASFTATRTFTFTVTATFTGTRSATPTVTITSMDTPTNTFTATPTFTVTGTYTDTATPTSTATVTNTPTHTRTRTLTATETSVNTATNTPTVSPTSTATRTFTDTRTLTGTPTSTRTSTPANSYTDTQTTTRTFTATLSQTYTFTPTATPTVTPIASATNSPTITCTLLPVYSVELAAHKTARGEDMDTGAEYTYTLELENDDTHDASNIVIWDTLPEWLAFVSADLDEYLTVTGNYLQWDLPASYVLVPGDRISIEIKVTILSVPPDGVITNIFMADYNDSMHPDAANRHIPVVSNQCFYPGQFPVVYPNPYSLSGPSLALKFGNITPGSNVTIYTLSGEKVRSLYCDDIAVRWDLKNSGGIKVSPGIYYFIVSNLTSGQSHTGKVFIIK